ASLRGEVAAWSLADAGHATKRAIGMAAARRSQIRTSADGRTIGIASWDGAVDLFDADTLSRTGTLDGHDQRVNDIVFDGHGSLFSADSAGRVRKWDLQAAAPMFYDYQASDQELIVGKYSPNGEYFIAGGKDGVARVYNVASDGRLSLRCAVPHANLIF